MGFFERVFKSSGATGSDVDPVIDRLVAATDRRLSYVKGYRDALRGPVAAARDRMREAVARIPGPMEVGAAAWSRDDTVRSLFAKAADVPIAFSNDPGTRAWFDAHPGCDCIGMLGLEKRERRILTSALQGETVQAEVARTTVSFTEPQVLAPGADETSVRAELVQRALEYLALRALERVGAMRAEKHELEKERALLQAQLRLAQTKGAGFAGLAGGGTPRAAIEKELERTVRDLEAAASRKLLPGLLDEMLRVLASSDDYLTIEASTIAIDSMNFAVDPSSPQAIVPRVAMLKLVNRGPFAVLLARFPRAELATDNRLAEAEKLL